MIEEENLCRLDQGRRRPVVADMMRRVALEKDRTRPACLIDDDGGVDRSPRGVGMLVGEVNPFVKEC